MGTKKNPKKYTYFGIALYYFILLLSKTFRYQLIKHPDVDEVNKNYVMCFWHHKILNAALNLRHMPKKIGLASPSKDGELIAIPLERLGFEIIRGSSNKKALASLLGLLRYVKKGYTIGTPVDGPKGPPHKAKLGLLYLAQKSGVPLLPIGGAYSRKWIVKKAWDQFQIPKPFAKLICILGEPIYVDPDADLEVLGLEIEKKINELNDQAEAMIKEGNNE